MPRIDEFGSERSNNGASAANAERVQRDNAATFRAAAHRAGDKCPHTP